MGSGLWSDLVELVEEVVNEELGSGKLDSGEYLNLDKFLGIFLGWWRLRLLEEWDKNFYKFMK